MPIGEIQLTAVGNLTDNPELRFTQTGVAVAAFTVAVNPREFDKESGKYKDGEPSFVRVQCWRQLAENCAESLTRGMRVVVHGRWREEHWQDAQTGEKRAAWRLTADAVGVDLTWVTAKVSRSGRSQDTPPDDPWASASKTRPAVPAQAGERG